MNRNIVFANSYIYHIYNRGVHKSKIYLGDADYRRWENLLSWQLSFNYPYSLYLRRITDIKGNGGDVDYFKKVFRKMYKIKKPKVEIICYVEMPNHYHLVLRQVRDGGIIEFMHKLSTAYTMYFNRLHGMSGSLFEGRFKAVSVRSDEQLLQLSRYVHLNPLKLVDNTAELVGYKWSSYPSYAKGEKNPLIRTSLLADMFENMGKLVDFTLAEVEDEGVDIVKGLTIDDDFGWYESERIAKEEKKDEVMSKLMYGA